VRCEDYKGGGESGYGMNCGPNTVLRHAMGFSEFSIMTSGHVNPGKHDRGYMCQ
jgi:hypothetical protein